jgi:hypothetical protein
VQVDGYFVAERRRLLFHLPLGYNARKRLSAWDYYVVSVYGGVPRGNDVRRCVGGIPLPVSICLSATCLAR